MIPHRRTAFNADFTAERYHAFLRSMDRAAGVHIGFRISETPVFITAAYEAALFDAATSIVRQLMTPEYEAISEAAFPENTKAPNQSAHPEFVQVDFAVTQEDGEGPDFRLIELQGFPSLYGFQEIHGATCIESFGIEGVRHLARGFTRESYYEFLRDVISAGHDPVGVVLLEVDPLHQKTLPDFLITERRTGIPIVDIATVEKIGRQLFYADGSGRRRLISRIYNRAIIDEIERRNIAMHFRFTDDLDVSWACHPNWFYRISKFSIPYIDHPSVPRTHFLDQLDELPADLSRYVLKPLYSFAGSGVIVSPTEADIRAIPNVQRSGYLLQEKVRYAPVLDTPAGPTKIELRVMFLWRDEPVPVMILVRTGRGDQMGVNFNKNFEWVGASCCLVED